MLLEHLYRISLEEPVRWAMFIGLPANTSLMLEIRIDLLDSYIHGFRHGLKDDSEAEDFFGWLRDVKGEFPARGWATKYLDDCDGAHIAAITKFWGFLHEYLLKNRPDWFLRLSGAPLPSQIKNGAGTPDSPDIRNENHVRILGLE